MGQSKREERYETGVRRREDRSGERERDGDGERKENNRELYIFHILFYKSYISAVKLSQYNSQR